VAWGDTDPYRCGLPDTFVNRNFRIQDYRDWTLNASPYLLLQGDRKWVTAGQSFQSLLEAPPKGLVLSPDDYDAHLNMLFPDIRIKNIIEVRVFDALPPEWTIAVPAVLKGLVYSETALRKLETWLLDFEVDQFGVFRKAAAKEGIRAEIGAVDFAKLGIRIMESALEGLGSSEEEWLLPYFNRYTKHKRMPADEVVAGFERSGSSVGRWLKELLPDPNA
jgi:glutamate--cysteine ligase